MRIMTLSIMSETNLGITIGFEMCNRLKRKYSETVMYYKHSNNLKVNDNNFIEPKEIRH
jgi:hypothetical protein